MTKIFCIFYPKSLKILIFYLKNVFLFLNISLFLRKQEKLEEGKLDLEAAKVLRMHGGTEQLDVV